VLASPFRLTLTRTLLVVATIGAVATVSEAVACPLGPRVKPDRSIGPVRLGEALSRLEREIGPGTATASPPVKTYQVADTVLKVVFKRKRVASVETVDGTARLYGHSLDERYRTTARRLRARGWLAERCYNQRTLFHNGKRSSTVVTFNGATFSSVRVGREGGGPGCALGSPVGTVDP